MSKTVKVVSLKTFVFFLHAIITYCPSIIFHFVCVCFVRKLSGENFRREITLIIFLRENYALQLLWII